MNQIMLKLFICLSMLCIAVTSFYLGFSYSNLEKSGTFSKNASPNNENDSGNLAPLTFCELTDNREKYDGKTVRLKASLSTGLEGSWFSDENCGVNNAAVVYSVDEEVWSIINQAREQKNKNVWNNKVNLLVIGKFRNIPYNKGGLTAPFQFEIIKIEKAST